MIVAFLVIACLIAFVIYMTVVDGKKRRQFEKDYLAFVQDNEGLELFCYTNRAKFCSVIESKIIPQLADGVSIIKLSGKEPETELSKEYISYTLNNLKEIGFPNVMTFSGGSVYDISLHKRIYDSINNNRTDELPQIVKTAFVELRKKAESQT